MRMKSNPEKLTCVSIMICDEVYRDEATKKLIVVGTFNTITATTLPCTHPQMVVLFTLANGQGKYELSFSVEHESTGHTMTELKGPLEINDPLGVMDINVTLKGLAFAREGRYWVILSADGEIVGQRPFWLRVLNQNETGNVK